MVGKKKILASNERTESSFKVIRGTENFPFFQENVDLKTERLNERKSGFLKLREQEYMFVRYL